MFWKLKTKLTSDATPEDEGQAIPATVQLNPNWSSLPPAPADDPATSHGVKRPPEGWLAQMSPQERMARTAKKLQPGDNLVKYPGGGYFVTVKQPSAPQTIPSKYLVKPTQRTEFRQWLGQRINELNSNG